MHTSTKWLIGLIALMFIIPVIQAIFGFPMFLPYEWHKALHIFGGVLLLGNIIVTGMWMFSAHKTGNETIIKFGARITHWADVWFTAPGTILLLINGLAMANTWGGIMNSHWIIAALVLFSLSGIIWIGFLIPAQNWFVKISWEKSTLPPEFYTKLNQWYFWGSVATILPVISMFLMVMKPTLW
jgi:uncharacterized membrane protein